jgi:hypothetical protein
MSREVPSPASASRAGSAASAATCPGSSASSSAATTSGTPAVWVIVAVDGLPVRPRR